MKQTRLSSFYEACIGTGIGFALSLLSSPIVYPLFGHSFTLGQNIGITVVFTALSVARSYAVRRWFNGRIHSAAKRLAGDTE